MERRLLQVALSVIGSVLLLQGCLLDVTSVVAPGSTSTGKVITLTINGTAASTGIGHRGGIVLQVPAGTTVLRVYYSYGSGPVGASGFLVEDPAITTGYTSEAGYQLSGWAASGSNDGDTSVALKVWLSIPDGVSPGVFTIKAAVGGYDPANTWVPQNPHANGSAVTDFAQISGKYASNAITISAGGPDNTSPGDVTPTVYGGIVVNISAYDEAVQGDVAKYRVYLSKGPFNSVAGRQLLDKTTAPTVTGNSNNNLTFSSDVSAGLFYFEVPPGAEYPITVNGLPADAYYFAVTAVDLSGNESSPVVIPFLRGAISGRVTDGTAGIVGVQASVHDISSGWTVSATTTFDGTYTIGGLPTGTYKVEFQGDQAYPTRWYNDKADMNSADLVTVTGPNTTTGIDAVLAPPGGISGRVTDGAKGIQGVGVEVRGASGNYVTFTAFDGTYSVKKLPTGSYKVEFQGTQGYLTQWYNDKVDFNSADPVLVTGPNTTTGIDAVLALGGSISGRVTDGTMGIQGIRVEVRGAGNTVGSTTTASDGTYLVKGLPTGNYKVEFQGSQGYLTRWYNNKADMNSADLVPVTAPNATAGIDAVLALGGSMSGRVTDALTGAGIGNVTVALYSPCCPTVFMCMSVASTMTDANGSYAVSGLPTGTYRVVFSEDGIYPAIYHPVVQQQGWLRRR